MFPKCTRFRPPAVFGHARSLGSLIVTSDSTDTRPPSFCVPPEFVVQTCASKRAVVQSLPRPCGHALTAASFTELEKGEVMSYCES